jgi:tetratricopeptide (TPR) repeat protein
MAGEVHRRRGELDAALALLDEAQGLRRELARRDPTSFVSQRDLLSSLTAIAGARMEKGELEAARAAFEEVVASARAYYARNPTTSVAMRDVSMSLRNLGAARDRLGDAPGALAAYEESLDVAMALADKDPSNRYSHRELIQSGLALAYACYAAEIPTRSALLFDGALVDPAVRADLGRGNLYTAARAAARAAEVETGEAAARYRRLAIEWVAEDVRRRLEKTPAPELAGHFEDIRANEPAFASLRGTPEFEAFVATLPPR